MRATWHRVSLGVDSGDKKAGTVSFFFDYDLRCWLFGISIDPDPSWFDLKISLGPIGLSLMYWRRSAYLFNPDDALS